MAGESYEIWVKKLYTKPNEGWEQVVSEKGEEHFFDFRQAERVAKAKAQAPGLSEVLVVERRPIIRINVPPPARDVAPHITSGD